MQCRDDDSNWLRSIDYQSRTYADQQICVRDELTISVGKPLLKTRLPETPRITPHKRPVFRNPP
jgi:hypothetical protein